MKPKLIAQIVLVMFVTILVTATGFSQTSFFNDTFGNGSTINSFSPAVPTTNSASYEEIASKLWSPTIPTISTSNFLWGMASSSGGTAEIQTMFSTNPVVLTANGDYITMVIVYTNVAGMLTSGQGFMGFGLYNTGSLTNFSVPGGLNANANTGTTTNSTANAALWQGYFAQVAYSTYNSAIETRPVQTTSITDAGQDLVTTGSGSESFQYPKGAAVGSTVASTLILNSNQVYTEVFTIAQTNTDVFAITNTLYQGVGTNTTPLTQFGGVASGSTFLTGGFNGLAMGWYEKSTAATTANVVAISSISIFGQSTTVTTPPLITAEPAPLIVATNGYAQFSVAATGFNLTYQWYRNDAALSNGGDISGATSSTLVINPAGISDAFTTANGYYCVVDGTGNYSTNTVTNSLTLVPATNLVWTGSSSANWDVDNSVNWETTNNSLTVSSAVFTGGDPVSFNDAAASGSGNTIISLVSNVAPASVSVATMSAFTFQGTGSIVGSCNAVFNGDGVGGEVELNANNAYTGGTLLTNDVYAYLENYNGLGNGPVILDAPGGTLEITAAGSATVGVNGGINIVSNFEFQIDGTGTYASVFFGDFSGSSTATLDFEPANLTYTNRVRLYGTNTVCNANIFIDGPTTTNAQYNGNEIAFYGASGSQTYNGVISGNGGLIERGNAPVILNGQNTFSGGITPTAGAIGIGANSVSASGTVTSSPLGAGPLCLAPEVPAITGSGEIYSSGGAHTIANVIEYPSGTNNLTLIIGGTNNLTLTGPFMLAGADTLTTNTITSRILQVTNTGLTTISGVVSGTGYGLMSIGTGVLALNNTEAYNGPTAITNGTLLVNGQISSSAITVGTNAVLGGSGTIGDPVTVVAGGSLVAGNQTIGTLAINNTVTFQAGSTNFVDVSQSSGNSKVIGVTTINYDGVLAPVVISGTLTVGQTFTNFVNAGAYTGNYSSIVGTPGTGLTWAFNPTNGALTVVGNGITVPNTSPKITSFNLSGANVSITATNGVTGGTYYLLGTTNLITPIGQWVPVATNVVTASGNTEAFTFTGTNVYTAGAAGWFFMLSSTNN